MTGRYGHRAHCSAGNPGLHLLRLTFPSRQLRPDSLDDPG